MKQIDRDDLKAVLLRKGFRTFNTDHEWYYLYVNDKKTEIRTKISFGSSYKVYGIQLLSAIKKQLRFIDSTSFNNFLECRMQYDDYIKYLKENNRISL